MTGNQTRKLNRIQAVRAFITDNAADFPKDSPGDKADTQLGELITEILALAGLQSSNAPRQNIGIKDDLLADLIKMLQKMNRAANAMAEEIDGIENLFRMPRRRSEEIWLATARAFYNDSAPFEVQFTQYDLPAAFRAELLALISSIETAAANADTAEEQRGGATGGLIAAFRETGILVRRLNAIVRNKYADNPQKLAAWEVASHLEAAPKRTPKPTPTA